MRRAKRERANESAPRLIESLDARRTALPQNCSTKTLALRSAFVNSTTMVGNSTTVLQENLGVRSREPSVEIQDCINPVEP